MTDFARLVLDADTRGLKKGEKALDDVSRTANETAMRVGSSMKNIGLAFTAVATGAVALFAKGAFQAAVDAQEMESAFDVVFGNMSADVRAWAEETGNAMGRSRQEIQRGALAFQELFGKALDPAKAAEMSKQFAVLTQDLASFKNLSNDIAQQKLFSGLTGEAEPLRAVGVFINDAAVKSKALEIGLKAVNGQFTDQQKIVARAALIQEQLANAQGDVIRTSDSAANKIKAAKAAYEELQVTIGNKLIPVVTPLIEQTTALINSFSVATGPISSVASGLQYVAENIGTVFRALTTLAVGFATYKAAVISASLATTLLSGNFGLLAGTVVTATARFGLMAGAQVAYSGAAAAATSVTRSLTAALIANPFTAVAAALAVLVTGMWALRDSQAAARAETNNLINSLKGLAQARSADFAIKRNEAQQELNTLRERQSALEEQKRRLERVGSGRFLRDVNSQLTQVGLQIVGIESKISQADRAFDEAGKSMSNIEVPAATAATSIAKVGKAASETTSPMQSFLDSIGGAEDRLELAREAYRRGTITIAQYREEVERAERAVRKFDPVPDNEIGVLTVGNPDRPLIEAGMVDREGQRLVQAAEKMAQGASAAAVKIKRSFEEMAEASINSLRGLIDAIKGGDFLGILGSVFGLLGNLGISTKGGGIISAIGGLFRADGGAVGAGNPYIVGERGPELFIPRQNGSIVPNSRTQATGGITLHVDARGATDPAAVRQQINLAMAEAAPALVAAAEARTIRSLQRPRLQGLR